MRRLPTLPCLCFILFSSLTTPLFAAHLELWDGTIKKGGIGFADGRFSVKSRGSVSTWAIGRVFEIRSPKLLSASDTNPVRVTLIDGSEITGDIAPSGSLEHVNLLRGKAKPLALPTAIVYAIAMNPLLPGVQLEPPPNESYIVMTGGKILPCKVEWFTARDIGVKMRAGRLRLKRSKLHRIVFGNPLVAAKAGDENCIIRTRGGDSVRGRLVSLDRHFATLQHPTVGILSFPSRSLFAIEILSKRVTSLLDLQPDKVKKTPYFGFIREPQFNHSLFGTELTLQGIPFRRGIAVHSRTELRYQLAGKYQRFVATVGLDVSITNRGQAVFIVLGDGKELARLSIDGHTPPAQVSVSVAKVKQISLVFDYGAQGSSGDYGVWGHPRLLK